MMYSKYMQKILAKVVIDRNMLIIPVVKPT